MSGVLKVRVRPSGAVDADVAGHGYVWAPVGFAHDGYDGDLQNVGGNEKRGGEGREGVQKQWPLRVRAFWSGEDVHLMKERRARKREFKVSDGSTTRARTPGKEERRAEVRQKEQSEENDRRTTGRSDGLDGNLPP